MSDTIVGLDIGTSYIRVAIGQLDENNNIEIIGLAKNNSQGLRNGTIVNVENTMNAIRETIEAAEQNAGYEVSSCVTAIGGTQIVSENSHGQVVVGSRDRDKNNRVVTQNDVDRVLDAANAVQIPMDRQMIHIVPQGFMVDGEGGIKDPVNRMGVRLEVDVHIVTASKTAIQNVSVCVNRAGYELGKVMLKTLAATQAVALQDELELGSILIDLGAGTTDVIVLMKDAPICSFSIPVGGNLVTNDISIVKGIPSSTAERIKIESGCCYLPALGEPQEVIIPGVGGRPPEVISQTELCEILQARMEEIFMMVKKEICHRTDVPKLSGNIILTGGGAEMEGVVELAQEVFGTTAVRLGIPENLGGIAEEYRKPEFATVIGLVVAQKNSAGEKDRKKKKRNSSGKKDGFLNKLHDLFF